MTVARQVTAAPAALAAVWFLHPFGRRGLLHTSADPTSAVQAAGGLEGVDAGFDAGGAGVGEGEQQWGKTG
ncbi:hypothetical protein EAO69_24160 [Streptomyces sp. me109]|nr:hypothetical protein EAO69_24160 [Streptomyces sp. me109]